MSDHDEQVDWARVHQLRTSGMTAAAALEQARTEYAEQEDTDVDTPLSIEVGDDAADGRTCPSIESITWVASQLRRKSPDIASAPSETALALLEWAGSSIVAKAEFWKNLWSRTLPTRGEVENAARYSDDGSEQIELAQRILGRIEQSRVDDEVSAELRRGNSSSPRVGH